MTRRTSVLLTEYHTDVLERMPAVWPDIQNQSEAIRKAIEQTDYKLRGPGRNQYSEVAVEMLQRIADSMGVDVSDLMLKLIDTSIAAAKDNGCDCVAEFDDNGMEIKQ